MVKFHSGRVTVIREQQEVYIKLSGEIRVTLSLTLRRYFDLLVAGEKTYNVTVDLVDTRYIENIILKQLAQLAIASGKRSYLRPILWRREDCTANPKILCLNGIFDVQTFSADKELTGDERDEMLEFLPTEEETKSMPLEDEFLVTHHASTSTMTLRMARAADSIN